MDEDTSYLDEAAAAPNAPETIPGAESSQVCRVRSQEGKIFEFFKSMLDAAYVSRHLENRRQFWFCCHMLFSNSRSIFWSIHYDTSIHQPDSYQINVQQNQNCCLIFFKYLTSNSLESSSEEKNTFRSRPCISLIVLIFELCNNNPCYAITLHIL